MILFNQTQLKLKFCWKQETETFKCRNEKNWNISEVYLTAGLNMLVVGGDEEEHVSGAVDVLVTGRKRTWSGRSGSRRNPISHAIDETETEGDFFAEKQESLIPTENQIQFQKMVDNKISFMNYQVS
jgi:hypothetical protein